MKSCLYVAMALAGVLALASLGEGADAKKKEGTVWTVESGMVKQVSVGDTVRFYRHAFLPKGSIEVTAMGAGKVVSSSRSAIIQDGQSLRTGTLDMVYDVTAEKAGTIKIKVITKNGDETETKESEVKVVEAGK